MEVAFMMSQEACQEGLSLSLKFKHGTMPLKSRLPLTHAGSAGAAMLALTPAPPSPGLASEGALGLIASRFLGPGMRWANPISYESLGAPLSNISLVS